MKEYAKYIGYPNPETINCLLLSLAILIYPVFTRNDIPLTAYYNLSIFFAIGAIVIIIKLIYFLSKKHTPVRYNALDLFVAIYMIYIVFSSKNATSSYINDDVVKIFSLGFIYWIFKTSFIHIVNIRYFIYLTILIGIVAEAFGGFQIIHLVRTNNGLFPDTSFFRNPNIFTAYLTMIIPFAIHILINPSPSLKYARLINTSCWIFLGAAFFFIVYNFSRASIIVSVLIMVYYALQSDLFKTRIKPIILIVLVTVCCIFSIFYLTVKTKEDSTSGRILILKISSQMLSKSPLLGIGYGEYKNQYNNYQANYFKNHGNAAERKIADETYVPFNELFKILIENGIIGLILFSGIIFIVLRGFNEGKNVALGKMNKTLIISLLSILLIGLVSYPFEELAIYAYFFCLLGIISSLKTKDIHITSINKWGKIFMTPCYVLALVLIMFRYLKVREWVEIGQTPISSKAALTIYNKLYPFFYNNGYFQIDYAGRLVTNGYYKKCVTVLEAARTNISNIPFYLQLGNIYEKTGRLNLAEQSYLHACYMVPSRFIPRYMLFEFYKDTQQKNKMITTGDEILKMPVKVPSMEVNAITAKIAGELMDIRRAK